uniref:Uncharacterized protein n=1 Tax=Ditylenchus dipsaci TaxID=166011 RepID=A0A915EEN7_9BILA
MQLYIVVVVVIVDLRNCHHRHTKVLGIIIGVYGHFLYLVAERIEATPSVYSCASGWRRGLGLGGLAGGGLPGAIGYGLASEKYVVGQFLHYYTCCENYPFQCCFQFETWAVVFLSVMIVILVGLCLFSVGRFVSSRQE